MGMVLRLDLMPPAQTWLRLFSEELLGGHNQFGLDSALFLAPKLNLFTLTSVAQVFAKILILSDALVRSTYVELVP